MGLVGYVDRDNDIIQERLANRVERINKEKKAWNRERNRVIKISSIVYHENNKSRIEELLDIKEILLYKINLSLSVASSMESNTIRSIAESLSIGQEESYSKVRETIHSIKGYQNVSYSPQISEEDIKKNLVKNIFYRVENIINDVEEISKDDMTLIKKDLLKLIHWFYDKDSINGKIENEEVDFEMVERYLNEEMDTFFYTCPVCGNETVYGLKFCIECTEELK